MKVNFSKNKVFKKLKIKIKKEIVTMGVSEINPSEINGTICAEKNVIDIVINLLNKYADNRNLNIKVNFSKKKVFKKL